MQFLWDYEKHIPTILSIKTGLPGLATTAKKPRVQEKNWSPLVQVTQTEL